MSQFINGGYGLTVTIHAPSDIRNCDQRFFGLRDRAVSASIWSTEMQNRADNAYIQYNFATRWWPRDSVIFGGWSGTSDDMFQSLAPRWIDPWIRGGANGRLAFVGYTRDSSGNPISGCTVRLIRTSTDEMVAKVTSDANGKYYATSPYNDAHFLVIHSPSGTQAGATKDSLTPA